MGFMEKMVKQCRKPIGLFGRFVGMGMNTGHGRLRRWGLSHISINLDAFILDVAVAVEKLSKSWPKFHQAGKSAELIIPKKWYNWPGKSIKSL